jgi:biopolymer transport protein ExbD
VPKVTDKQQTAFTIAEGLLPLLDISVLLLGLFIVMFAAGVLTDSGAAPAADESSLPGIGQVILLKVDETGKLWVLAGSGKPGRSVGLSKLQTELKAVKQARAEQEPLVLVYYENPWRNYPAGMERQIIKALRKEGCRYARAYP